VRVDLIVVLDEVIFLLANGPELSCGDEAPQRRCQSARDNSRPIVTGYYARVESSTAISVSLSDWLGRNTTGYYFMSTTFRVAINPALFSAIGVALTTV